MQDVITNRREQLLLCTVLTIVTLMAGFNQSAISSAVPEIAHHFNVDVGDASWVETIYLLFMAGLILIFGKICDRGIMKVILFCGTVAFMIGSVFCILFDSYMFILIARAIQGIGASTVWCASVMIGVRYLPKGLVAWAMVSLTAGETIGSIAGPLVGGAVITFFGWKALFFADIILGSISLVLIYKVIPKDRFLGLSGFDVKGAVLLAVIMFSGSYCLEVVMYNGMTPLGAALILILVLSLYLFVRCSKRAVDPIIDLTLFNDRNTNRLTLLYIAELLTINGLLCIIPFYSVIAMEHSSMEKGLLMFLPATVACVASFLIGRAVVVKKKKPFMYITCLSIVISSVSMLLIEFNPMLAIMVALVLSGLLWALGEVAIVSTIVNSASDDKRCRSSVINSYIGNLSDAMGVAIFSKIFVIGSRSEGVPISGITHAALMDGLYLTVAVCLVLSVLSFVLVFRFKEVTDSPESNVAV